MKELVIEKTVKTPYVNFDAQSGILKIIGRSIPENPEEFYSKLFNWVHEYFKSPQNETLVNVQLERLKRIIIFFIFIKLVYYFSYFFT